MCRLYNHPLQEQERDEFEKQYYFYEITTQFRISTPSTHEIFKDFKNYNLINAFKYF